MEVFPLNTGAASLGPEIERVCIDNVLVITTWSPIHLRDELKKLYWKADKPAFGAMAFWEDTLRYIYLPRLKNRAVLETSHYQRCRSAVIFLVLPWAEWRVISTGFKLGDSNVQLDDTLLLIEPEAAKAYEAAITSRPLRSDAARAFPPGPTDPIYATGDCADRLSPVPASPQASCIPWQRCNQSHNGENAYD